MPQVRKLVKAIMVVRTPVCIREIACGADCERIASSVMPSAPSRSMEFDVMRRSGRGPWGRRAGADVEHAQHQSGEGDPSREDDEDGDHVCTQSFVGRCGPIIVHCLPCAIDTVQASRSEPMSTLP